MSKLIIPAAELISTPLTREELKLIIEKYIMGRLLIFFIVAFLGFSVPAYAKEQPDSLINVSGAVLDAVTEVPLRNARVIIKDSLGVVLIDSLGYEVSEGYRTSYEIVRYKGRVPIRGKYLVSISAKGYQPEEFDVRPTKVISNWGSGTYLDLGKTYLKYPQKERRLKEVTVTASKVKMVMRGDTLEYDATAFKLPEGSTLDNLIAELPGAQIDDDGRITVNGQFIQELLVNGRNFFKGDPQIALKNLPAYTVKNLQVYRREPEEFRGRKIDRDRSNDPLVMDVNLKKEYMGGWLANGEIGGGTALKNAWDTRWMGRVFAMRYTKLNYFAAYAMANNLNDPEKAGSRGQWHKPSVTAGQTTTKRAGLEFNTDWADQGGNGVNTTFDIVRQTTLTGQQSISEQFMEGGNTFSRSRFTNDRTTWNLKWAGEISRRIKDAVRIWFRTEVDFNKGTGRRTSESAESNSMLPENFTVPGSADFVRDMLYYRSERLNGRDQTFGVTGRLLSSSHTTNISLEANVAYHNSRVRSNSSDRITYPNEQNRDIFMLQHDFAPSRDYSFNIRPSWGKYRIQLGEKYIMRANVAYKYEQKYNFGRRTLEEMDNATDADAAPSVAESGNWILDEANSYRTTRREWNNGIEANLAFVFPHKMIIKLYDESYYYIRRLTDFRMSTLREVARNDWKNSIRLNFDYGDSWEPGFACGISGTFQQGLPEMLKMLDVIDSSNPLVVNLGNPNLKREKLYRLEAYVSYKKTTGLKPSLSFSGGWSRVDDALAMARTYNRQSGVTTWQPANISGRRDAFIDFKVFTYLTRDGNFVFENRLRPTFRHSVDYSSDTDIPEPVAVNSWNIKDNLILRYGISSDLNFRAKVDVDWTKMKSLNGLFLPFDYLDINYGIGAHAKIPGEVYVDTDLMAYCRRGYGDPTMNRTDWVWNLEISKTFGRAKQFTVKAIGFDLLQQLPTVQRTLNAQGRSEVRFNSQPAYALLTIAYRLDVKPKRK